MNFPNTNPSAPFGYYGGVSSNSVYFPEETYSLTYGATSIPFTEKDLEALTSLLSSTDFQNFLKANADSIMLRTLSGILSGNKVFEINTLNNLEEPIVYNSALSSITIAVTSV